MDSPWDPHRRYGMMMTLDYEKIATLETAIKMRQLKHARSMRDANDKQSPWGSSHDLMNHIVLKPKIQLDINNFSGPRCINNDLATDNPKLIDQYNMFIANYYNDENCVLNGMRLTYGLHAMTRMGIKKNYKMHAFLGQVYHNHPSHILNMGQKFSDIIGGINWQTNGGSSFNYDFSFDHSNNNIDRQIIKLEINSTILLDTLYNLLNTRKFLLNNRLHRQYRNLRFMIQHYNDRLLERNIISSGLYITSSALGVNLEFSYDTKSQRVSQFNAAFDFDVNCIKIKPKFGYENYLQQGEVKSIFSFTFDFGLL